MNSEHFMAYIADLLLPLSGIKMRKMFGGHGIYQHGIFFALVIEDILYFKVDDTNRPDYQAQGSQPFTYEGKSGKQITMNYWQVPVDVLEDSDLLAEWAHKAVLVAKRAAAPKKLVKKP